MGLMKLGHTLFASALLTCLLAPAYAQSPEVVELPPPTSTPWTNTALSPDERTRLLMNEMTMDEKLILVFGYYSSDAPWKKTKKPEAGLPQSAGYIPGVPRLGIPAQFETD